MPVTEKLLPWLPVLLVIALTVLGLAAVAAPAAGKAAKRLRLGAIAIIGLLTLAATIWQGSAAAARIARLMRNDRSETLAAQVKTLEEQVAQLKESTRVRSLPADTATKLADYLRPFGRRKIVVSCAPNDIEAYRYATDIANVLKAANWDARGPEATTIFGDIRAMGINVYDNDGRTADTAKILLDALTKFAIPYQSRVPSSEAMADSEAVELFIGSKPQQPALRPGTAH
jgi:transposase InsO family protein